MALLRWDQQGVDSESKTGEHASWVRSSGFVIEGSLESRIMNFAGLDLKVHISGIGPVFGVGVRP